ncbi:MAG: hypothetical protein G3W70_23065 [Xanthomonas perforans]|nr:hypothetical protein [Xanthomonas perforans]
MGICLMRIGLRRLLSQRRIRSVRLRIGLLRGVLAGVLLLRLLRLTLLDIPFLTLLQLALLAGLCLPLL